MQKRFIDKRISRKYEVGSRKKKNINFLLLTSYFLLLLSGCAERSPYKYYNIYTLVEPEIIKNGIKQPPSYDKEFEDDRISIKFTFKEKKIYFRLKNKTDKELKILWDRLSFADTNGALQRVTGFKNIFTDKMDKQPVQEIQAKTEINDLIVPIDNIELMEEWTWYVRPLFNQTDEQSIANMGKIFSISMPIEIAGDVIDYNYKFRIDHVVPQSTWVY
ncbi:MAG: hypothetical protein HZA00_08155 [Nitrospinae bacterium]|nr:hypothetical protein [Nitrospinota bacterium]